MRTIRHSTKVVVALCAHQEVNVELLSQLHYIVQPPVMQRI